MTPFQFRCSGYAAAAGLSCSFVLTAVVGSVGASTPYSACLSKAQSTREIQVCQQEAVADAGRRLNSALAQALSALPPDQRAKLKLAQQRWTTFRQSDCEVFYGNDSGTIATVRGGQCLLDRTTDRIRQLGDFSRREGK